MYRCFNAYARARYYERSYSFSTVLIRQNWSANTVNWNFIRAWFLNDFILDSSYKRIKLLALTFSKYQNFFTKTKIIFASDASESIFEKIDPVFYSLTLNRLLFHMPDAFGWFRPMQSKLNRPRGCWKQKEWKCGNAVNGFDYDRFANYFTPLFTSSIALKCNECNFVCRNKFIVWLMTKVVEVKQILFGCQNRRIFSHFTNFVSVLRIRIFRRVDTLMMVFVFCFFFQCWTELWLFIVEMKKNRFTAYLSVCEDKKKQKKNQWKIHNSEFQVWTRDCARRRVFILFIFPAWKCLISWMKYSLITNAVVTNRIPHIAIWNTEWKRRRETNLKRKKKCIFYATAAEIA